MRKRWCLLLVFLLLNTLLVSGRVAEASPESRCCGQMMQEYFGDRTPEELKEIEEEITELFREGKSCCEYFLNKEECYECVEEIYARWEAERESWEREKLIKRYLFYGTSVLVLMLFGVLLVNFIVKRRGGNGGFIGRKLNILLWILLVLLVVFWVFTLGGMLFY